MDPQERHRVAIVSVGALPRRTIVEEIYKVHAGSWESQTLEARARADVLGAPLDASIFWSR
jgi:post-segregation antitoxin (ccd killing protein)